MVCKLDFEKAYDMVDWDFYNICWNAWGLVILGFNGSKTACLLRNFVNGSPKVFFRSSRSLRRGDPLSLIFL